MEPKHTAVFQGIQMDRFKVLVMVVDSNNADHIAIPLGQAQILPLLSLIASTFCTVQQFEIADEIKSLHDNLSGMFNTLAKEEIEGVDNGFLYRLIDNYPILKGLNDNNPVYEEVFGDVVSVEVKSSDVVEVIPNDSKIPEKVIDGVLSTSPGDTEEKPYTSDITIP